MQLLNKYKIHILVIVLVLSITAYYLIFFNKKGSSMDRTKAIQIIKDAGRHSMADDKIFGDGFLIAWARAIEENLPSFIFEGKTYSVQGGKALKL
jgi:hypothetical protein